MKRKGAPGLDDIPPAFLMELGPKARQVLLSLYNESFATADLPQAWRHAVIIPLLKAGKPASELGSFRPISLTSCMVKLLERLINNRLYFLAESGGWLDKNQAGFRKGRCCEDQVIKLIQHVSDGFQEKTPLRTVMAQFDYSRAYDRTWREKLLLKLSDLGAPSQIIRWISAFLRTRTAQVMINGTLGKRVRVKQGLPQGSVLSPLLFLIFINDITKELPDGVECCLFADDAAVYCSDVSLAKAEELLQVAVTAIEKWSVENKLDLNLSKSCVFFFSSFTGDAKYRPDITLMGQRMKFGDGDDEKNPKLLGLTLDRQLSFQDHVTDVCARVEKRCKLLACLASRAWGWRKHTLRRVFTATQRSIMDYAAAAWQPWCTKAQMDRLEVAQNKCLRLISGQYRNSHIDALRLATGIPSYATHSEQLIATAYEKGMRLPEDHPRRIALDKNVRHRHRLRSSFRERGKALTQRISVANIERRPSPILIHKPWTDCSKNWRVTTNESIRHDISAVKNAITQLNSEVVVYTDGSCSGGTSDGGAAAVATIGDVENPTCIEVRQAKGNAHTSSYGEEERALDLGISWLQESAYSKVAFCTDSLSLLKAMDSLNPETHNIRRRLEDTKADIDLMYVPGHKDIPGNECADKYAKEAAKFTGPYAESDVSLKAARSAIRREIVDPPSDHPLISRAYADYSEDIDKEKIKSRKDGSLIDQLRSGHHKSLGYYQNFVDREVSATCQRCKTNQVDTVEHWISECDQTLAARQSLFGYTDVGVREMGSAPDLVVKLARKTLSFDC